MSATGKLDRPGGSLYFEVIDATPPCAAEAPLIVFHHGIGATADIWAEWLPSLLDRYRVARFDMLGFGRSGVPKKSASLIEMLREPHVSTSRSTSSTGRYRNLSPFMSGSAQKVQP